jgi:enoyl-CoA hydratase/carnithine racemase
VSPESVLAEAQELAQTLTQLDYAAHATTKLTVRRSTLDILAAGLASDRPIIDGIDGPRTAEADNLGAPVVRHG